MGRLSTTECTYLPTYLRTMFPILELVVETGGHGLDGAQLTPAAKKREGGLTREHEREGEVYGE